MNEAPSASSGGVTEIVSDYSFDTATNSCNDDLDGCEKAIKTHPPDRNGCMPVECRAGTSHAYFRYIRNPDLKAKALLLEREGKHEGLEEPNANGTSTTQPVPDIVPPGSHR
jgi:hypothetical protein